MVGAVLVSVVVGGTLALGGLSGGAHAQAAAPVEATARAASAATTPAAQGRPTTVAGPPSTTVPVGAVATTTTVAPVPTEPTTVPVPTATTAAPTSVPPAVDLAALVTRVEASGIAPGPSWTWSYGGPSACGVIPGANLGTGCTSGAAGSVTTVFAGSPGLLLVAHELANAETENYAVPSLVSLVSRSAGGASWSPIDAVASCLVVHFLGVQDDAAGPWACPTALADVVATAIHDPGFTGQG